MRNFLKFFTFLCILVLLACNGGNNGNISELKLESILGIWKVKSGLNENELEFQKDGKDLLFFSYINGKIDMSGTFSINNNILILKDNQKKINYKWERKKNTLILTGKNGGKIILIREIDIKKDEILFNSFNSILGNLESLVGIESSTPVIKKFTWHIDNNHKKNITGYSALCKISDEDMNFQKLNEKIKDIIDYFEGLDYKISTFNCSQFQNGLTDGNFIVILTTNNKNFNINVDFGKIK